MVKILSWNSLESGEGGAWANGWGCPLEIQRREELIKVIGHNKTYDEAKSVAETMLTQERYTRIRKTLLEELLTNRNSGSNKNNDDASDFLLFQEITVGDFWDVPDDDHGDSIDDEFFALFDLLYERVPCQPEAGALETVQHVYVRRDSGWQSTMSIPLQSKALEGGCLAEFVFCQDYEPSASCWEEEQPPPPSLVLVNLHGKSRNMRDPELRRQGILDLWEEIRSHFHDKRVDESSWTDRIVLCGDWNTQLSDLIEPFREVNGVDGIFEPAVGLLDNTTATMDYPFFSTNHEDSFLAQYDGCLLFGSLGSSPPYLELEGTSWNLTGFMPKGRDGKLSGDHPGDVPMYNNFTYYHGSGRNKKGEGVYLNGVFLPGTVPSMGLSDHLRIYTTIRINRDSKSVDEELTQQQFHQRRPYRNFDQEAFPSGHEEGSDKNDTNHETRSRSLRG